MEAEVDDEEVDEQEEEVDEIEKVVAKAEVQEEDGMLDPSIIDSTTLLPSFIALSKSLLNSKRETATCPSSKLDNDFKGSS